MGDAYALRGGPGCPHTGLEREDGEWMGVRVINGGIAGHMFVWLSAGQNGGHGLPRTDSH